MTDNLKVSICYSSNMREKLWPNKKYRLAHEPNKKYSLARKLELNFYTV